MGGSFHSWGKTCKHQHFFIEQIILRFFSFVNICFLDYCLIIRFLYVFILIYLNIKEFISFIFCIVYAKSIVSRTLFS